MWPALQQAMTRALAVPFVVGVLKLAGGAAAAQGILFAALYLATQLYTPADFSVLAVFNAVVTIVAVAACLRFDIAIPLPKDDAEALNLLALALSCAALIALLVGLAVWFIPQSVRGIAGNPEVFANLWLAGPGVFLLAALSAFQNYAIRRKAYGTISRIRICQATVHGAIQVGLGLASPSAFNLVLAQCANYASGVAAFAGLLARGGTAPLRAISLRAMRAASATHRRFPLFSTWEALLNAAGIFAPIIIIGAYATPEEAGHLQLALFGMQALIGLIGTAISQVYFSRAAEEHAAGRLAPFTADAFGNLAKIGPGPLAFIGIVSPFAFPLVFGEEWARSGVIAAWMTPWFILHFLAVPIALAFAVTGHQATALVLQLSGLVLRGGAVFAAALWASGWMSETYAMTGALFYGLYLLLILKTTGIRVEHLIGHMRSAALSLALWCAAAAGLAGVLTVVS